MGVGVQAAQADRLEASSQASGGPAASGDVRGRVTLGESAVGESAGVSNRAALGWVAATAPLSLNISVDPTEWLLGGVSANSTHLMAPAERIGITNKGETPITLSLQLVPPSPWQPGSTPGAERFALSGLLVDPLDGPAEGDFNLEDVIGAAAKRASASVFGFPEAGATGEGIPPLEDRAMFLLFKTPTQTAVTEEQQIQVIITAEIP